MCLTGTAEIPLGGAYMDAILPAEQLPIRMAAFGHCFRTEAGAAGAGERRGGGRQGRVAHGYRVCARVGEWRCSVRCAQLPPPPLHVPRFCCSPGAASKGLYRVHQFSKVCGGSLSGGKVSSLSGRTGGVRARALCQGEAVQHRRASKAEQLVLPAAPLPRR